ncbi:hypothetical protein PybrP1_008306 [[Pythium] brassicae (nom. inval.)]|nr:hypothetical protein PybrP1_008306 [[Pythium] brassicae (nom. inval.)]
MGNSKSALVGGGGGDAQSLEALLARSTALSPELFALAPTAHHGVPSSARALAFCGRQGLLALGTASGAVKLIGRDELEVLLPSINTENVGAGVAFLQFTARQRLVVAYTDSSVRVFDLAAPGEALAELRGSWTTSAITCVETIRYQNFPFVFIGTDDGAIHVLHEDTCRLSTYAISPRDVGVAPAAADNEGQSHSALFPTAIAANPRDADHVLLAYDAAPTVFLWDLAKRKVVREFTLAPKRKALARTSMSMSAASSASDSSSGDWATASSVDVVNSPQTLSWHASGKRFAVGYKHGGFAVFRTDKSHGHYHAPDSDAAAAAAVVGGPIKQLQWVCAPPCSKNAALAGALVFSRGDGQLTLVAPPPDVAADDALAELVKAEQLAWRVAVLPSANRAEVVAFAVASDQVDAMAKPAPLSVLVLSGNPLDGCLPRVSVQPLPCFVRVRENDQEDWEWRLERLPPACVVPPMLQLSPLTAFAVVDVLGADGALQDDLTAAWDQDESDPHAQLLASEDFEWPVNGGSLAEPLLRRFLSNTGALEDGDTQAVLQNGTLLLTGHASGVVLFWELVPAADRTSNGALRLLHTVDVPRQMAPAPEATEISSLAFCHEARVLIVGFSTGEMAVLEFGHWKRLSAPVFGVTGESQSELDTTTGEDASPNVSSDSAPPFGESASDFTGFKALFSLHIHNQAIQHLSLSTAYGYVAAADAGGVVSLTQIASETFKLVVFELPSAEEEPVSVESLLLSELAQTADLPPPTASAGDRRSRHSPTRTRQLSRSSLSTSSDGAAVPPREMVPVLYVGRGNGKLEMFHVQSGTKVAESLVDPRKASSLSSLLMVDSDGARVGPPGRAWVEQTAGDVTCPDEQAVSNTLISAASDTELAGEGSAGASANASEEREYTERAVRDVLSEHAATSSGDVALIQTDEQLASVVRAWRPSSNVIKVAVPPGPLGLHLFADAEQHAVVEGFVAESGGAAVIEASGVRVGHVLVSINSVDVTSLSMRALCDVLAALRDRAKTLVFAEGGGEQRDTGNSRSGASRAIGSRRFLVCTCGRWIHLVPAAIPRASEMASGVREVPARPLASVELSAAVLATWVVRVPVAERVESCLVAVDQSNRVYVLSLLALAVVWEATCPALGSSLDGVHCAATLGGELVVANAFGEVTRVSLLAERPAAESALLARTCVKTRLLLDERAYPFAASGDASPKKKSGGIADAGKLFKKLVTGAKDDADLNRLFQFSADEDARAQLFSGRHASASQHGDAGAADASRAKTIDKGLGGTKDALMQATQHLHERGEKLGDLALKTEQMKQTSEDFYQTMKAFNDKNAKKKWYDF